MADSRLGQDGGREKLKITSLDHPGCLRRQPTELLSHSTESPPRFVHAPRDLLSGYLWNRGRITIASLSLCPSFFPGRPLYSRLTRTCTRIINWAHRQGKLKRKIDCIRIFVDTFNLRIIRVFELKKEEKYFAPRFSLSRNGKGKLGGRGGS